MRIVLARSIAFYMVCLFSLQACGMGAKFRGSADEVKSELFSLFPLGTKKEQVMSVAKHSLKLDESKFHHQNYEDGPLVYREGGQELHVYSWLEMSIAEYRPVKRLFMKTMVVAKLFFDKNDELNGITVTLTTDSL